MVVVMVVVTMFFFDVCFLVCLERWWWCVVVVSVCCSWCPERERAVERTLLCSNFSVALSPLGSKIDKVLIVNFLFAHKSCQGWPFGFG